MLKHMLTAILFLHYPTFVKESVLIENDCRIIAPSEAITKGACSYF